MAHNRGKTFPEKRTNIDLYLTNELPIGSHALKIRLIKDEIKQHRCEECNRTEWNGKPIPIQLHHKDGNSANNTLTNLQIVCPNCHAQTDNYCSKNHMHRSKPRSEWVTDGQLIQLIPLATTMADVLRRAGLSLAQGHYVRVKKLMAKHPELKFRPKDLPAKRNPNADPYWRIRPKPEQRKYQRPSKEALERAVWEKPSEDVAVDLGISGTLLCRWCKDLDVAKPPRGYWSRRASGLSHQEAMLPLKPKQPIKRLTDQQILEILALVRLGDLSLREIGELYNVCHQVIIKIRDGESYKHVSRDGGPTENFTRDVNLERVAD